MPAELLKKRKSGLPKLIAKYYADLKEFAHQLVMHEMGIRPAFHGLLASVGNEFGWTLIAEQEKKINGKIIRPDGTFKDKMNLVRGYWEAKDTSDNLEAEIEKKRKAGYPFNNILFEDSTFAVLYQNGLRILKVDMRDPAKLEDIVVEFFRHIEPEIEAFEDAIDEFKTKVPDLAEGLAKKIDMSHKDNPAFKAAFADFFELCRTSLNPNLSQAAVDEMLIQHILTERLIREIFDNPEFVSRNIIAAEVEKVMLAMTSRSFDRKTYLKELDRFYVAIERAARTMTDFSDKQHFLNTVYERFFQGYSVKLADTMGIVYTPQEIVDFMCASVAEVLEKEFGKKLWSDDVCIIDPCTGTGNFIVNLIRRIPKAQLEEVYRHRLFANEIMLLPYYIAALNIEHAYYEQTGRYESFEGLCFVDTLDMAEHAQGQLSFMTAKNAQRVERQKNTPITVVIGNPPYNSNQERENDNNKNRSYPTIDANIKATYAKESRATLKNKLYDPYVRFFWWALDRLRDRDGIVCFVTNHSFCVDPIPFDGMRKRFEEEFTSIYHVDLHGNIRKNPKLSGTTHNVFGIQTGVGITVAVRKSTESTLKIKYHRVPEIWKSDAKLSWLADSKSVGGVEWKPIKPDKNHDWVLAGNATEYASFISVGTKVATLRQGKEKHTVSIFARFGPGAKSNRDDVVYDFSAESLLSRVEAIGEAYNSEVDRYKRKGMGKRIDDFVDASKVRWSSTLKLHLQRGNYVAFDSDNIRESMWRPFTKRFVYFDPILNDRLGVMRRAFPDATTEKENIVICCTSHSQIPFVVQISNRIMNEAPGGRAGTCFPFYVYDEDGSNRRENITDWSREHFREHYKNKKIDKWAIFYYIYGVLHHPAYREKFADNLKRELPRIPFAPDFYAFSNAGKKLAKLHLDYEKQKEWKLSFGETPRVPLSYRVEDKMRLNKDMTQLNVNPSLTLSGIPSEVFEYRLGNRSALDWVIDQYQVSTDKRSGITSDPNRADDEKYIVRLIGQVIRVSFETVQIVKKLPTEFAGMPC